MYTMVWKAGIVMLAPFRKSRVTEVGRRCLPGQIAICTSRG